MASEIKIGSRVQLLIKDCPLLIVENIKDVISVMGDKNVNRKLLSCIWFDASAKTFRRDDFYADTVYSVE